jgi:hypothetical protein
MGAVAPKGGGGVDAYVFSFVIDIGLRDIRHRPWCEILVVLGCFAAEIGSLLPTSRDNLSGPVSRVILQCTLMSKMCCLSRRLHLGFRCRDFS